jgi:hypothetical protein
MFPRYLVPRLAALASFHRRRTMASLANRLPPFKAPIEISYPTLLSTPPTLFHSIGTSALYLLSTCPLYHSSRFTEQAFGSGPDCLGIILVRDLPPEYLKLRERLLKLAHAFARLDETVREKYADTKSSYRFDSPLMLITGSSLPALGGPMERCVGHDAVRSGPSPMNDPRSRRS